MGTWHNLQTSAYSFFSDEGMFEDLFELVYLDATLGISTEEAPKAILVYKDGLLAINSYFVMDRVQIFDLQGGKVFEKNGIGSLSFRTADVQVTQQVLLIKITGKEIELSRNMVF